MMEAPTEVIDYRPIHRTMVWRWLVGVTEDGAEIVDELRVAYWRRPHRAYVAHRSTVQLLPEGLRVETGGHRVLTIPAARYSADGFTQACMSAQAVVCQAER